MNKKKKYIIIAIVLLSIIVLTSIGTYAWYVWSTDNENETLISTKVGTARVIFDGGKSIIGANLKPTNTAEGGIVKTIRVVSSLNTGNINMNLYLDVVSLDESLKDSSFKYKLISVSESQQNSLKASGDFSLSSLASNLVACNTNAINTTEHIVLLDDEPVTDVEKTYVLYIWIDNTMENNNAMQNSNFSFRLHADGVGASLDGSTPSGDNQNTLATYIVNKYTTSSDKSVITNNGIEYNASPSLSLMNDRLGGTTNNYNGGNVRYYGTNPDNYIYFNCSDYDNQTDSTCEKWRIIGVFGDSVKIQRGAPLSTTYAWDSGGINNWTTASLNTYLNGTYYNGLTSQTKDFIDTKEWKLGGACTDTSASYCIQGTVNIFPDAVYDKEIGTKVYSSSADNVTRDTTWTGKIALSYPSDFKYATINNFTDNWMIASMGSNYGWLLTPTSNKSDRAWVVKANTGAVSAGYSVTGVQRVTPTLFLKANSNISGGTGSSGDPYKLTNNQSKTLIKTITDFYNSTPKTEITYDEITYNYAPNAWLMNDRQGGVTTSLDGGNIRYYGESPNNYIYFNCTDYSNQSSSTCEVWRIIGIIDGKVKLIKGSNIGLYPYNEGQSGNSLDFSESSISNYLNNNYYNNSITASTRTLISPTVYSYGNIYNWNYPHEYYGNERSTDSGQFNIALSNPSDYGYAQDLTLNNAIFDMADWNDGSAYGNWLENVITDGNGGNAWLLNTSTNTQGEALAVNVDGGVFTSPMTTYGYLTRHYVTPVLYLNTNLKVQSGNGTSASPYKLIVS